jgi:hypothetical protein
MPTIVALRTSSLVIFGGDHRSFPHHDKDSGEMHGEFLEWANNVFSPFQKKIPLEKFFELASKLVLDQSADFFRHLKTLRDQSKPLTPSQELDAFFEVIIWEFFIFEQALSKFPDHDNLCISDRLRTHAWWRFFDPDRARYEELRQRTNERIHEYYALDGVWIDLYAPGFSVTSRCAEYIGAQFGYLKYGTEFIMLMNSLSGHFAITLKNNLYQILLRKTDLRLAKKIS